MKFLRPCIDFEEKIREFKDEFLSEGEWVINGGELLDSMDSVDEWIEYVSRNAHEDTLQSGWVLTDTYLAVVDERIVGIICLRHYLNDFLDDFGHIAFSVRPDMRRRGYATGMLSMILDRARDIGMDMVKLSAKKSNVASIKCIINNGGVYSYSFDYEDSTVDVYIIDL